MSTNEEKQKPVLFPIDLLDYDICMSCPDIEIENQQMVCYSGTEKLYSNRLQCAHVERCRHLRDCMDTHEKHAL